MTKCNSPRFAAVLAFVVAAGATQTAFALPLRVNDEGSIGFTGFTFNSGTAKFDASAGYLICANTEWLTASPAHKSTKLTVQNGTAGSFKFGVVNVVGAPTVSPPIIAGTATVIDDVRSMRVSVGGSGLVFSGFTLGGAPGTLGCYSLDASANRVLWYNGLFVDAFENAPAKTCPSSNPADPCISLRVASIATDSTNSSRLVYKYFIDYYLPAADASYVLRDGYDSTYLNGAVSLWCNTNQNLTDCPGFPAGFGWSTVDQFLVGHVGAATQGRIIVNRVTNVGVTNVSSVGTPMVIAGLFPEYSEVSVEHQLNNNVASGGGSLSNFAPIINTASTELKGIVEGGSPVTVLYQISDDSPEAAGNLLRSTVSVNFNGNVVTPAVNCGSATPQPGPGASRNCSFNIVVPTANFATDSSAGTFAPGVFASVTISATDSQGVTVSSGALPMHVSSSDNDAPSFSLSIDGTHTDPMPTITCSLAALSTSCGGSLRPDMLNSIVNESEGVKTLTGFVTAVTGPVDAVDERAAQNANFQSDTSTGHGGNIKCTLDSGSLEIFQPASGYPKLTAVPGGSANLSFGLNQINVGSATCEVKVVDAGQPGSQSPQVSPVQQFRVTVTP
ncbi:MAG: hypothetical protein ABI411_03705 [Tahibacter sp.]